MPWVVLVFIFYKFIHKRPQLWAGLPSTLSLNYSASIQQVHNGHTVFYRARNNRKVTCPLLYTIVFASYTSNFKVVSLTKGFFRNMTSYDAIERFANAYVSPWANLASKTGLVLFLAVQASTRTNILWMFELTLSNFAKPMFVGRYKMETFNIVAYLCFISETFHWIFIRGFSRVCTSDVEHNPQTPFFFFFPFSQSESVGYRTTERSQFHTLCSPRHLCNI